MKYFEKRLYIDNTVESVEVSKEKYATYVGDTFACCNDAKNYLFVVDKENKIDKVFVRMVRDEIKKLNKEIKTKQERKKAYKEILKNLN